MDSPQFKGDESVSTTQGPQTLSFRPSLSISTSRASRSSRNTRRPSVEIEDGGSSIRVRRSVSASRVGHNTNSKVPTCDSSSFEYIGTLGSGVSGSVTRERYKPTGLQVAIKRINFYHKETRGMLEHELLALQEPSLQECDNLVKFYNLYWDGDESIRIVLEFLNLGSLETVVNRFAPNGLSAPAIAIIAKQTLKGLDHLHQNHYVHRDLKPANVLLNSKWVAKVADFGLIKSTSGGDICTTAVGTNLYKSPERALTDQYTEYGTKSDIWSFGLVIYYLATGQHGYRCTDHIEFLTKIKNPKDVPRLESDQFPPELVDFVDQCLHFFAEDRWDAKQLLSHEFLTICDHIDDNGFLFNGVDIWPEKLRSHVDQIKLDEEKEIENNTQQNVQKNELNHEQNHFYHDYPEDDSDQNPLLLSDRTEIAPVRTFPKPIQAPALNTIPSIPPLAPLAPLTPLSHPSSSTTTSPPTSPPLSNLNKTFTATNTLPSFALPTTNSTFTSPLAPITPLSPLSPQDSLIATKALGFLAFPPNKPTALTLNTTPPSHTYTNAQIVPLGSLTPLSNGGYDQSGGAMPLGSLTPLSNQGLNPAQLNSELPPGKPPFSIQMGLKLPTAMDEGKIQVSSTGNQGREVKKSSVNDWKERLNRIREAQVKAADIQMEQVGNDDAPSDEEGGFGYAGEGGGEGGLGQNEEKTQDNIHNNVKLNQSNETGPKPTQIGQNMASNSSKNTTTTPSPISAPNRHVPTRGLHKEISPQYDRNRGQWIQNGGISGAVSGGDNDDHDDDEDDDELLWNDGGAPSMVSQRTQSSMGNSIAPTHCRTEPVNQYQFVSGNNNYHNNNIISNSNQQPQQPPQQRVTPTQLTTSTRSISSDSRVYRSSGYRMSLVKPSYEPHPFQQPLESMKFKLLPPASTIIHQSFTPTKKPLLHVCAEDSKQLDQFELPVNSPPALPSAPKKHVQVNNQPLQSPVRKATVNPTGGALKGMAGKKTTAKAEGGLGETTPEVRTNISNDKTYIMSKKSPIIPNKPNLTPARDDKIMKKTTKSPTSTITTPTPPSTKSLKTTALVTGTKPIGVGTRSIKTQIKPVVVGVKPNPSKLVETHKKPPNQPPKPELKMTKPVLKSVIGTKTALDGETMIKPPISSSQKVVVDKGTKPVVNAPIVTKPIGTKTSGPLAAVKPTKVNTNGGVGIKSTEAQKKIGVIPAQKPNTQTKLGNTAKPSVAMIMAGNKPIKEGDKSSPKNQTISANQ